MLGAALLVFAFAGVITFIGIKEREAWITADIHRSLFIEGLLEGVVVASVILISHYSWSMLAPSVLGAVVGRWLSWRF